MAFIFRGVVLFSVYQCSESSHVPVLGGSTVKRRCFVEEGCDAFVLWTQEAFWMRRVDIWGSKRYDG